MIKLKRKKRRELKDAVDDEFRCLKTDINYLQKEIKQSIRQSEEQKTAINLALARDKGSKGFWRAIKELTNDHESNDHESKIMKKRAFQTTPKRHNERPHNSTSRNC